MIVKRILATIIDIMISFVPIFITDWFIKFDLEFFLYKSFAFYILHTSILIFIIGRTAGEKIVNIKILSIDGKEINTIKIFIRNLVFSLYFLIIIISLNEVIDLIFAILLFLSLNIIIFFDNKNKKPMTAIDFIFQTYFENV